MPLDEATQAELADLIADLRDRELSDDRAGRLAEILRSDRDARLEYLRQIDRCASIRKYSADLSFTHDPAEASATSMLTEALMRQHLGAGDAEELDAVAEAIVTEPVETIPLTRRTRDRGPLSGWLAQRMLLVAMAAAFVAVALPTVRFMTGTIESLDPGTPTRGLAVLTAVDGAEWDPANGPVFVGRSIAAETLHLNAGTAELTFDSGARVQLNGPCEFTVNDRMGGQLAIGRLSAYVPPAAAGFTVTGPGFAIIDRGTAFTVEVPRRGRTWVLVTEGAVDLAMTNDDGSIRRSMRLTEDLSAEVDPIARQITVTEPVAIGVRSTGAGLGTTEADPNWRVTARRSVDGPVPDFTPGPAYAADYDNAWVRRTADDPARWVTVLPSNPPMAGSTVQTFATSFDLTGLDPETAKLRIRFIVDNHLDELRVNGLAVDVPAHGDDAPFGKFTEMTLRHVFVEGVNTLEFDVRNIWPTDRPSPTGLLVEISGVAHRSTEIDIRSGVSR